MADSQRKTANLFDKDDDNLIYNRTNLAESNLWSYGGSGITIRRPCKPSTTYTLACDVDSSIWRLSMTNSNDIPISDSPVSSNNIVRTKPVNGVYTFTTGENTKYILFQATNTLIDTTKEKLMLNTGSTALPYEPYWKHSLRKLTTATEAVENPLYSDGTAITAYTIKGNTVQDGTPTPSNPVDVNGVGERTANLYNAAETVWTSGVKDDNGNTTGSTTSHFTSNFTAVKSSTKYSITGIYASGSSTAARIYYYDSSKVWISRTSAMRDNPLVFETPANCEYVQIQCANGADGTDFNLVEGEYTTQTMPPLEPYGYKIPISSANTTTPVYLGEAETTRKIKKLVLDGTESWSLYESGNNRFFYMNIADSIIQEPSLPCTHGFTVMSIVGSGNYIIRIYDRNSLYPTKDDFTDFLADQYAAGTPVTVWYVLATATTGVVNEPLMKIGDFADTLSNATTIPTTDGANTITVDTTVQPSEFTATWTGWHDSSVKEYDGSDWQ